MKKYYQHLNEFYTSDTSDTEMHSNFTPNWRFEINFPLNLRIRVCLVTIIDIM